MSIRQRKKHAKDNHECPTCGNLFNGTYCSDCGEKVFHRKDLSLSHITEQTIDLFTHLDLKIPKSIAFLFRPGYLTEQFLKGIRVPYAKPVQLFIIVNLIFFFAIKKFGFTDFTPLFGDHTYFTLHESFSHLRFMKPLENKITDGITHMGVMKAYAMQAIPEPDEKHLYNADYMSNQFNIEFRNHSIVYSKTLIFLLVLLATPIFYLIFYRKLKYVGAAFIFCCHFVAYYLLSFSLFEFGAVYLGFDVVTRKLNSLLFKTSIKPISEIFFLGHFEMLNVLLVAPWLFFAFKRLLGTKWYISLPLSLFLARVFYFLTFGVYKKLLVALTVWLM
jgi:Protein of unknown function (DUF3667)